MMLPVVGRPRSHSLQMNSATYQEVTPVLILPLRSGPRPGYLFGSVTEEALDITVNCDTGGSVPMPSENMGLSLAPETRSRGRTLLLWTPETFKHSYLSMAKLGAILGKGASCTVHLATVKVDGPYKGMRVAVRCTERQNLRSLDEENLNEEGGILRRMNHPNIVEIYQLFQDDPTSYYVVLELMEGGELFDRIVEKVFYNEKEARDLCRILLDAVKYIHDRGIVHRDLKPENLLLTSKDDDATIKLADFGFARSVLNGYMSTQCGTPGYVAPEILRGEPYGMDLVKKLLTVDPEKRLMAEEAVLHPWLISDEDDLSTHDLSRSLEQFKLFNARRKLRAAIN